jgi:GTP-binding protein
MQELGNKDRESQDSMTEIITEIINGEVNDTTKTRVDSRVQVSVSAAEFVLGASALTGLPKARLPELALIGRSNVGKSSLINRLANRRGLARASSTPGRTQEINLFRFTLKAPAKPPQIHLIDLPGYGYAKMPPGKRDELAFLMQEYLIRREGLKLVCLLLDCRRDVGDEERGLLALASEHGRGVVVTVTKADKLGATELAGRLSVLSEGIGIAVVDLIVTGEKFPVAPWWQRVLPLL